MESRRTILFLSLTLINLAFTIEPCIEGVVFHGLGFQEGVDIRNNQMAPFSPPCNQLTVLEIGYDIRASELACMMLHPSSKRLYKVIRLQFRLCESMGNSVMGMSITQSVIDDRQIEDIMTWLVHFENV